MRRFLCLCGFATLTLSLAALTTGRAADPARPIKVLIITGDNIASHDWKGTTKVFEDILASPRFQTDVTTTPSKDLSDENLAKYDVLLLNYKDTKDGAPESKWSEENKQAFLKAIRDGGKGLYAHHFASAAFTSPASPDFEKAVAGGWRTQGYHGPKHEFTVKRTEVNHPISEGAPARFGHAIDELYSACMRTRGSVVIATAYCDASKPQGTGIDEPVVWVNQFGRGRVVENVLGHDTTAMADKNYQEWVRRCVEWAGTGQVSSSNGK
jgi:type 1 glutamine amidotransferase